MIRPLPRIALASMALLLVSPPSFARSVRPEENRAELQAEFDRALAEFDDGQQSRRIDRDQAIVLYRSAARRFENMIQRGVVNGKLEFNTGNAYLQAADVGRAILHYRRAERLIPRDPLLADNLSDARKRCLTNIPPSRRSVALQNVFFWHHQTSLRGRWRAALVFYVGCWTLLAIESFVPRRSVTITTCVLGGLSLMLFSSVAVQRWQEHHAPQGVVTSMDVVVYKGPGTGYQRLFEQPLQPGVEFTLRERRAGWWNIELPDGRPGWIDETTAALVTSEQLLGLSF